MATITEEEGATREGGEDKVEHQQEGDKKNHARLYAYERLSREFLEGILEYLSDTNDNDGDGNGDDVEDDVEDDVNGSHNRSSSSGAGGDEKVN